MKKFNAIILAALLSPLVVSPSFAADPRHGGDSGSSDNNGGRDDNGGRGGNNGGRDDHGGRGGRDDHGGRDDRGGRGGHYDGGRNDWDRDRHRNHGDYYYAGESCSPDVVEKNFDILETTVDDIAALPSFQNANDFQTRLVAIHAETDLEKRISAYTALVGVNANDPIEVAEFLGAREQSLYIQRAQKILNINADQATVLVNAITENLLNGINN